MVRVSRQPLVLLHRLSIKLRVVLLFFGHDIDQALEAAKSFIGLVPQEFNFNQFESLMKILVNQAGYYGVERKIAVQRAEKYLKQLDLWEKRNDAARMLSGGYETPFNDC
eukprot:TRINITY_DN8341_c0_g1_i1.p1 TRINITY_DN8341_c0_g1~~TRINITY_DN8341_c0_g1_i1.p1  ORF type:complete len:110 (+),score=15.99 TRINITY_DN8341_c0_g1_i1:419-748(+)